MLETDWISELDLDMCSLAVHVITTFKGIFCFLCTVPTTVVSVCQLQGQLLGSLPFAEHHFPLSPGVSI